MIRNLFTLVALFLCVAHSGCTQSPFQDEINAFVREDSVSPPPKNPVLFVGSSSFRMWKTLKQDFPNHKVLNRGFGGSSLEDVLLYKDKIIFPYQPRQIVVYCGENDIAAGVSALEVFERFKKLYAAIRSKLPNVPVVYVSMKPSPSREKFKAEVIAGNKYIQDFMKSQKNAVFVDVFKPMLNPDGSYREDLYLDDRLHMNGKGYAIWIKALEPLLM